MKVETKKAIIGKRSTCTVSIMQDGGMLISMVTIEPDEIIDFCSTLEHTLEELLKQVRKERGELK